MTQYSMTVLGMVLAAATTSQVKARTHRRSIAVDACFQFAWKRSRRRMFRILCRCNNVLTRIRKRDGVKLNQPINLPLSHSVSEQAFLATPMAMNSALSVVAMKSSAPAMALRSHKVKSTESPSVA